VYEAGPPHSPAAQVTCYWYHHLSQEWVERWNLPGRRGHESSLTTKLYHRTRGQVSFEEVKQSKSEVIHCIELDLPEWKAACLKQIL